MKETGKWLQERGPGWVWRTAPVPLMPASASRVAPSAERFIGALEISPDERSEHDTAQRGVQRGGGGWKMRTIPQVRSVPPNQNCPVQSPLPVPGYPTSKVTVS